MRGLCHSSELTLRSPQLITVDGLDTEGISGAAGLGVFSSGTKPTVQNQQKLSRRHFWHSGQQCQGQRLHFALVSVDSLM